jgi:tetratricopeptide (TPR) repeat protein
MTTPRLPAGPMEPRVEALLKTLRSDVLASGGSALARGRYAMACDVHGYAAEAIAGYRQAMALDPADARWPYHLAAALDVRGDATEEVATLFERAVRLEPGDWVTRIRLGDARARAGDHAAAEASYRAAAALAPDEGSIHRRLGQSLLALCRDADAVASLTRAAELLPADSATWSALAQARRRTGDADGAETAARASQRLRPAPDFADPKRIELLSLGVSSAVCRDRAAFLLRHGDFQGAIRDLTIVAESFPADAMIQAQLGEASMKSQQPQQAMHHLRRAIELQDSLTEAHIRLGSLLADRGQLEEAITHFQTAVRQEPENAGAHSLLALALGRSQRFEESLAAFDRSAALATPDAQTELNWGTTLLRSGRAMEAIEHYQRSLELQPRSIDALWSLGRAYEQIARPDLAIGAYEKILAIDPGHRAAQRIRDLHTALERPSGTGPGSPPGDSPIPGAGSTLEPGPARHPPAPR